MTAIVHYLARIRSSIADKQGLVRNLLFMTLWQAANYLAPLITFPHLARTLEPGGFGQLGIYLMIGGYMTIISDWGTNYNGAKMVAQHNAVSGDIDSVFTSIFTLRLTIVVVLLIGVVAYSLLAMTSLSELLLLLSAWSIAFGNALTVSWCLQGLERLDAFATAAMVGRLVTVPATILLVRHADQVWVAIAVQGLGGIVIGLISILILHRRRCVKKMRLSWSDCWTHCRESFPILVSTVSHGLYSSTATMMLGWFQSNHTTGIFVSADRIRLAIQGLIQPIFQSLYPRISRQVASDRNAAVRTIRTLAIVQCTGMMVLCCTLFVLAPWIIRVIAGPGYEESTTVLRILLPSAVIFATNVVLGPQTLLPFGFQKLYGRVSVFAAMLNVGAMPLLVYNWGADGAALGVLATEVFMFLYYSIVITKLRLLNVQ